MSPDERELHAYLGDGVYAECTPHHIVLRTGDHRDTHCDNKIYLEQDVLVHFLEWVAHVKHIAIQSPVQNLALQKLFGILAERCKEKVNE